MRRTAISIEAVGIMAIPDISMKGTSETRQPAKTSPPNIHYDTSEQIQSMLMLMMVPMLFVLFIVKLTRPALGQLGTEVNFMVILAESFNTSFVALEPERP